MRRSGSQRPFCNKPEQGLSELAFGNGWHATKRGWPDFVCVNSVTGERIAVEVKPRNKNGQLQALKREQADCMDWLTAHGIRCFVGDGMTPMEKYDRDRHYNRQPTRLHRFA